MTTWAQINVRIPLTKKKKLVKDWRAFNEGKEDKISFNAFVASFWKAQPTSTDPLHPLIPLGNPFVDERGAIQNILNRNISAVAIINSLKDTTRSNHWHKTDWHYLYVISGKMLYWERSLDFTYNRQFLVSTGEMVFTRPGLVHRTDFLEDTTLLSLGNYTDHDADTVKELFEEPRLEKGWIIANCVINDGKEDF
jgi:quercetin dioxygenase-like cupin family protein